MDITEFIENFADQFDDTDVSEIKVETVFKELDEWSSLIALSVIAMVDEEYDVTIKGDDILGAETIEDLFNLISPSTAAGLKSEGGSCKVSDKFILISSSAIIFFLKTKYLITPITNKTPKIIGKIPIICSPIKIFFC